MAPRADVKQSRICRLGLWTLKGVPMKNKNSDLTRRDLLKILGSLPATVPAVSFAQLLLGGLYQKANAQTSASGKKYAYFTQPGSPPRWMFDLFLTPFSKTGFIPSNGVGTVGTETSGRYTGIKYETIVRKGLNVPPVWGVNVIDGNGSSRPLDALLDNFLSLRGIYVPSAGHPLAQTLSFRPTGAEYTISGLAAESGLGFPIRAINTGCPGYEFSCRTPLTPTNLSLNGALTGNSLLAPFMSAASTTFISRRDQLKSYINTAVAALDNYANSQHSGSTILASAQSDASSVMGQRATDLLAKWNLIYPKYDKIMRDALQNVIIPGLTDKPYGEANRPADDATLLQLYKFYTAVGIRTPLDLRDMFSASTVVTGMAESFTLVELAFTEDLCNSICTPINHLSGLSINGGSSTHVNDEHFTSAFTSVLLNTKMYAALGACMLELVSVLKSKNMFDKTVIQVGGEFNRSPAGDGSGSGHGYQGASTTIISGMVQGPLILGNISNASADSGAPGSWGCASPSLNGRMLDVADVANTLAKMLDLPQILRRSDDIIALQSGKVVSQLGTATQV